jgi:hypothetical protein
MSALVRIPDSSRTLRHFRKVSLPDSCNAANSTNVRCIHVPVEELATAPITDCPARLRGSMELTNVRFDLAYLFERRQVAGAVPNVFLKAREKAASEL